MLVFDCNPVFAHFIVSQLSFALANKVFIAMVGLNLMVCLITRCRYFAEVPELIIKFPWVFSDSSRRIFSASVFSGMLDTS